MSEPYFPIHLGMPGCKHRWAWRKVQVPSPAGRGQVTRMVCVTCGAWKIDLGLKAAQDELRRKA